MDRLLLLAVSWLVLSPLGSSHGLLHAQTKTYDLLVSSRTTNSVKRYNGQTGAYIDDFIAADAGGLNTTQEVLLGPDGHLYVSGRFTNAILKFHRRTGELLGAFTSGYTLDQPTKMSYGPDGHLYVSQWGQQKSAVARFDGVTGAFIDEATPPLQQGMQSAWDAGGTLHVVSFGSRDVQRFDATGAFIDVFTSGKALQGPVNLWFDDGGDLLVIDWQAGTVERFDGTTGAFISTFITGFSNAEGWTIGPDGALYIADWAQNRVNRYNAETGAFLGTFAGGNGLAQPNSVLFVERLPTFGLTSSPIQGTVALGSSATFEIAVTPDPDVGFAETVELACPNPPAGVTCSFSPAMLTPDMGAVASTLTVGTAAAAAPRPLPRFAVPGTIAAIGLLTAGGLVSSLARRPPLLRWAAIGGVALAWAGYGCGGATDPGPQERVERITVTGTAASMARTIVVDLTITGN